MNLQTFFIELIEFLNTSIIPFLLAIAFVVFIWNIARYFIIGGQNEQDQEKARSYAMWSILAFVIILSFWGIVNMFISASGFDASGEPITPDYMNEKSALP